MDGRFLIFAIKDDRKSTNLCTERNLQLQFAAPWDGIAEPGSRKDLRSDRSCGVPGLSAGESSGAIAQLGERHNGIVEVIGSIPISSTT